jgi:hypothetical protein
VNPLAAFQVITIGRFWVIPEVLQHIRRRSETFCRSVCVGRSNRQNEREKYAPNVRGPNWNQSKTHELATPQWLVDLPGGHLKEIRT